jgi:NADPH:quinone reductase-like Zn-dependent oxidoreductase
MLFVRGALRPGQTVLVQGAAGGVASAAIALARAGGLRVWATSRDEERRQFARDLGAHEAFEPSARLPERVDAVIETVGQATWQHSLRSLRPGGAVIVAGATTGPNPPADLNRVFFLQERVIGSTMGTREELEHLVRMLEVTGVRPRIERVLPLAQARDAFAEMAGGTIKGKIVFTLG